MPFVYILRCGDDSLYTGIALNVERRLIEHRAGKASRFTRARLPVVLVWTKRVRSWSAALRTEHRIKQLTRRDKLLLIETGRLPRAKRPQKHS